MGKAIIVDFSNVKDGGEFNPRHMKAGDYRGKVTKWTQGKSQSSGNEMITFTVVLADHRNASYPYRCTLTENTLWKLRNLLQAAGMSVPKKKVKVDPDRVVGKEIGIELEDDEYEGKMKSVITSVFSPDELSDDAAPADDDDDDDEESAAADDDEDIDELDLDEV